MKVTALVLGSLFGTAIAAPAIVWRTQKSGGEVVHSSDSVKASALLSDLITESGDDSSLAAAVFLLERSTDGSETLSDLASSGMLPLVASKYDDASAIHSHVAGIESSFSVTRDAAQSGRRVLQVSLSEFSSKMTSMEQKQTEPTEMDVDENGMINKATKRATNREKALLAAEIVVVKVPASTDPSEIDAAVSNAVEHTAVRSVVLAGVRSTNEVKHARHLEARRKMKLMDQSTLLNGRRLEDAAGDDDGNGGNNNDMTGVYYVHMTPNIFAGILFTLMFAFTTWIGVSCMGMISGQDVYVNKMPTIGREA